eukprot:COSAG02_NODE_2871_length_7858_cov_7.040211_3_plen_358_part_00
MICVEAGYLLHHVRTYAFVEYKHNLIEAIGHTALMLLYAVSLIMRNDSPEHWALEWFPQEGYSWFIVTVFAIVLPAPSIWFHCKHKELKREPQDEMEFGVMDNPLSRDVDINSGAPALQSKAAASLGRAKQAKMLREAKQTQVDNQKLRTEVAQLQKKLRMAFTNEPTTVAPTSTGQSQASVYALGGTDSLPTAEPAQELIVKELAEDETLSAETRDSAKKALEALATSKIQSLEAQFLTRQIQAQQDLETAKQRQAMAHEYAKQVQQVTDQRSEGEASTAKEMSEWLARHRLLLYADQVVRVAGADASLSDLHYLTESDVQEMSSTMTNIEKRRFQEALRAVRGPPTQEPEREPEL